MRATIGIGSNIDPERNISRALGLLMDEVEIVDVSRFYRTVALGRPEAPEFLNGACSIETDCVPRALKTDVLARIEDTVGRVRTADKYAPRTIDLDIALYGDLVVDETGLRIPDPDIRTRAFLAAALYDLDPRLILPDTGEALEEVLRVLGGASLRVDEAFTRRVRQCVISPRYGSGS